MSSPFVSPRWLARHVALAVSLVAFAWIGWWQLVKARGVGDWQNYGYAVQWWLFGAFAVFLYVKTVLDELDPSRVEAREQQSAPEQRPVLQRQAPVPAAEDDDELAEYNRRLAALNESAARAASEAPTGTTGRQPRSSSRRAGP